MSTCAPRYVAALGITLTHIPVRYELPGELSLVPYEGGLLLCYGQHYLMLTDTESHTLTDDELAVLTLSLDQWHHFRGLLKRLPSEIYNALDDNFGFHLLPLTPPAPQLRKITVKRRLPQIPVQYINK